MRKFQERIDALRALTDSFHGPPAFIAALGSGRWFVFRERGRVTYGEPGENMGWLDDALVHGPFFDQRQAENFYAHEYGDDVEVRDDLSPAEAKRAEAAVDRTENERNAENMARYKKRGGR